MRTLNPLTGAWAILGAAVVLVLAYGGARIISAGVQNQDDPPTRTGTLPTPNAERASECTSVASAYDHLPLVWAGSEVLGFALDNCADYGDSFTFVYGTCSLPTRNEPSCSPPILINVDAPCALQITPGRVAETLEVRGAPAIRMTDGGLVVYARGVTLNVTAPNPEKVVEELVPANELARALQPGDSLNVIDPVRVGPRAEAPATAETDTTTAAGCLDALNAEYETEAQAGCQEAATQFATLPLVYPGNQWLDYRLWACGEGSPDSAVAFQLIYTAYRECPAEDGARICSSQMDVWVMKPCEPDAPGDALLDGEIRGSLVRYREDRVYIDAPAFKLWLQGTIEEKERWPELAAAFVGALVPANELASALKPGDPLSVIPANEGVTCE